MSIDRDEFADAERRCRAVRHGVPQRRCRRAQHQRGNRGRHRRAACVHHRGQQRRRTRRAPSTSTTSCGRKVATSSCAGDFDQHRDQLSAALAGRHDRATDRSFRRALRAAARLERRGGSDRGRCHRGTWISGSRSASDSARDSPDPVVTASASMRFLFQLPRTNVLRHFDSVVLALANDGHDITIATPGRVQRLATSRSACSRIRE